MAVIQSLQRDGVVEIPRVGRVDRHDRLAGEIRAAADRFVELAGLAVCFVGRVGRKAVGQVELADDRKRVDARRTPRAEHFGDHALAVVKRRGETDHLDDHFIVRLGVLGPRIAHVDRPGEQRAVDPHVGRPGRLQIGADELVRLPLDDFDDRAARAEFAPAGPADFDQHHVASGGVGRAVGRNVNVLHLFGRPFAAVQTDETEALLRPLENAQQAVAGFFFMLSGDLSWARSGSC